VIKYVCGFPPYLIMSCEVRELAFPIHTHTWIDNQMAKYVPFLLNLFLLSERFVFSFSRKVQCLIHVLLWQLSWIKNWHKNTLLLLQNSDHLQQIDDYVRGCTWQLKIVNITYTFHILVFNRGDTSCECFNHPTGILAHHLSFYNR
jgi:hypothetical protein